MRKPPRWTVARKLTIALAVMLTIFGAAAYFALAGLLDLHRAMHLVERDASRMSQVLRLESAVRDQYAHIAHTIIIGNDSHLRQYRSASARVAETARQVVERTRAADHRAAVEEIQRASRELDDLLDRSLVPAVRRGDAATAAAIHDQVLDLVSRAQAKAEVLSDASERSIRDFGAHANVAQHVAIRLMRVFLVAAALCAMGVAIYLHRVIGRPIAGLAAAATRIGSGDLDTKLPVGADDEVGRLAEQLNAMTSSLKEHQAQVVQSERLASIGRLAAGVAHEINNPLGVILGYVKLLRRKSNPALEADLKIVEEEAERCREVIDDLLDVARKPPLEVAPVDLRLLCDGVAKRLRTSLAQPGVRLEVEGHGSVMGSERRLGQVLHNLLKNAVEAVGEVGRVHVNIAPAHDGRVAVVVADTGPGIGSDDRRYVFEPFFTTKPSGTGLGLAVSRAIARAHGGELELGAASDRGTVFRLLLPESLQGSA
jgi:signal transduction histidine kinase